VGKEVTYQPTIDKRRFKMAYDTSEDNGFDIVEAMFGKPNVAYMSARRQERIRAQALKTIERAEKDIERAERRLALLESFPEDHFDEGTVLWFEKKFPSGDRVYTYCALKAGGKWYLTGPSQSGLNYDWGALLEFVIGANAKTDVKAWQATEWAQVGGTE
jgi:hypothetical protein